MRRGLPLPAALAAVALAPDPAAAVSPALLSAAVRAAHASAAGEIVTVIPAEVIALANGVSRTMFPTSLRIIAVLLAAAGVLGTGAGVLSQRRSGPANRPEVAVPAAQVPDADAPKDDKLRQEVDRLRQENERLRRGLQKVVERLQMLEADRAVGKIAGVEVHFKGKTLSYWLEQLRDRDAGTRIEAVHALAAIGEVDPQVIPVLAATLKDRNLEVRVEAVKALAHIGEDDRKAVPVLIRAVKEGPSWVRAEAVQALASLADPGTIPTLTEALGAKEVDIRAKAAEALGAFSARARAAVPELARVLRQDGQNPYVSQRAAIALLQIGPAAVPALADILKDSHPDRRLWAVVALAGGGGKAVPLLGSALKDPDRDIRFRAAQYLGLIGDKGNGPSARIVVNFDVGGPPFNGKVVAISGADAREAVSFLRDALNDRDSGVRVAVTEALGRIGPEARLAVPALLRLWENKDGSADMTVQYAVAGALWRIDPIAAARARAFLQVGGRRGPAFGPGSRSAPGGARSSDVPDEVKGAIPTLIRSLADKDPDTRAGAASALGVIGPDAAAAIPSLTRALQDDSEAVRAAAAKALDRVRDP
jgi:HEAT repeat protein